MSDPLTPREQQDTRLWLTAKGWTYAGYYPSAWCIGARGRDCVVTIRRDKPSMRCEFCERTLRLPDTRAAA